MKKLIQTLFDKSIELGDVEYSAKERATNWIGNAPASKEKIQEAEERLNVSFPEDYKVLLDITNGFKTSNDAVEPSFIPVEDVDYLKNIFPFIIEDYEYLSAELETSILIAGKEDEQQFLLLPPNDKNENWRYWKFANWIPGEEEHENLSAYLHSVIDFINETLAE